MKDRRGVTLSGARQQQVAIVRTLASNHEVSLPDEPTEGIQLSIIREMVRRLRQIRDGKGLSMIVWPGHTAWHFPPSATCAT